MRTRGDSNDHEVFEFLRRNRARVVPVVGAGLSAAAGGASSAVLLDALKATGAGLPGENDLYRAADSVEGELGRTKVQATIAEAIVDRTLTPTPELLALALLPSRLIVTTNYDDAVEVAVAAQHRPVSSFTAENVDLALRTDDSDLVRVLHLHGHVGDPSSIVLTSSSYSEAQEDERLVLALRQLASQYLLIFLGHSLAGSEVDIRKHLGWVTEQFKGRSRHLLVASTDSPELEDELDLDLNVRRITFPDPNREYRFVTRAACAIGGSPRVSLANNLPLALGRDPVHVAMPLAPADEVETETSRAVWLYGSLSGRVLTYPHDVKAPRLLITGGPGFGKTQTLLQMASDADHPSLVIRLPGVAPLGDTEEDLASVLCSWAADAEGGHTGVPPLTRGAITDQVREFYFDALDDVPRDRRADVARTIVAFADAFPQHRWVIATRRPTHLDELGLEGFARYALVPSRPWLFELARRYGVHEEDLEAVLAGLPGISDLAEIPFYGAAIVAAISSGEALPETPLGLAIHLANQGFDREGPRLRRPDSQVREWLNNLAFSMEVIGATSIERERLSDPFGDLDRVVERTLLIDAAAAVRFPANVVQEARAAEVLLRHPAGVSLFQDVAVQAVDGVDYIRPSWRHTTDLILASTTDPEWHKAVGNVDRLAAARAVSPTAGTAEKLAAAATIWDWYSSRGLHLPARLDGQLRDDLEAFRRLVSAGLPDPLRTTVINALGSGDSSVRGNAVQALASAGEYHELEFRLASLLDDPDPVVRRRVAEAAVDGSLGEASDLAVRAATDNDELARRTLASAAVRRGKGSPIGDVLDHLQGRLRREITGDITMSWSRSEQLSYMLASDGGDAEWVRAVASAEPRLWPEQEVRLLSKVASRLEVGGLDAAVRSALLQHPIAAVEARAEEGLKPHDLFDLRPLLDVIDDADLEEVIGRIEGQAERQVLKVYRDGWRQAAKQPILQRPLPAKSAKTVKDLVISGDGEALLAHRPRRSELEDLSAAEVSQLRDQVQRWWDEARAAGQSPALSIQRTPTGWTCSPRAWQLLEWGVGVRLMMTPSEWLNVAAADFPSDGRDSLREMWEPTLTAAAAARIRVGEPIELRGLLRAIPHPWPDEVAAAAQGRAGTGDAEVDEVIVEGLLNGAHEHRLRALASTKEDDSVDAALVSFGDCIAEERLLKRHLGQGAPIPDHFDKSEHWLNRVSCRSSAPYVVTAIEQHLELGTNLHDLRTHFAAMERIIGEPAAREYGRLISDPRFLDGRWLWFNLRQFIDRISEELARARLPQDVPGVVLLLLRRSGD